MMAALRIPKARTARQRARAILIVNVVFPVLIGLLVASA